MERHTFTKADIEQGLKAASLSLRKRKVTVEQVTSKSRSVICIVLQLNYSVYVVSRLEGFYCELE